MSGIPNAPEEPARMIRLLPRPGLLTGVVVAASLTSGILFGAATVSAALALRIAVGRMKGVR